MRKQMIGFAYEYYTLWDICVEPCYVTDAYGNHHHTHDKHIHTYIKNISKDKERAMKLHPSLEVDEELRGKTQFVKYTYEQKPPEFFWFGGYYGMSVGDVLAKDFKYCERYLRNYDKSATAQIILSHPLYLEHIARVQQAQQDLIDAEQTANVGDTVEVLFTTNGWNYDESNGTCYASATLGSVSLHLLCKGGKLIGGRYPYIMPQVNGKTLRTKGKAIAVNVEEVIKTEVLKSGLVRQVLAIQ